MFDITFWKASLERAAKTAAQVGASLFAAGATILDIDWGQGAAVVATAALLSILSSIASDKFGAFDGPSLTTEALVEPVWGEGD